MFEGAAIGIKDKHGKDIRNGDYVRFYYKGEYVICQVIYKPEWALFCLKWSDGYINKYPMDGLILEITDQPETKK